jgi:hypothetical protein
MNSNDEYVNQITLKYLTSIDYQNDVHGVSDTQNEGCKINKSKHTGSKIYRQKDKKFYKKRISNIIKLLLNDGIGVDNDKDDTNQPNYPLFPDIKNTFDIFVKSCIDYFKSQDKCDIIQNNYNNFQDVISPNPSIMTSEPANNIINNNEINALMMRKIASKKNSIDSFVKRTSTRQTATIIPHKKKINLQDPELKTKGLGVVLSGTVAKPPKNDTPPQKDKNICENKNNNIYKETIPKLDILSKNDNQEEKKPNEKDSDQKKHKKDKKQKNKKNTLQLFIENNE